MLNKHKLIDSLIKKVEKIEVVDLHLQKNGIKSHN
jgi:hypothetical protein